MNMPEVNRCFGTFPPKYACFLISLFGMGSGGVGITGLVLFALVEDSLLAHFVNNTPIDETIKKSVLVTVGLSSLLLLIGSFLLFIGNTCRVRGCVVSFVWIIFALCLIIIAGCIGAPVSCFFLASTCIIKKISTALMVFGYLSLTIFLEIWLYFMVVANNLVESM